LLDGPSQSPLPAARGKGAAGIAGRAQGAQPLQRAAGKRQFLIGVRFVPAGFCPEPQRSE